MRLVNFVWSFLALAALPTAGCASDGNKSVAAGGNGAMPAGGSGSNSSAGSGAGTGEVPQAGMAGSMAMGSAGAPPIVHMVGKCDSLGKVDDMEEITPAISLVENGVVNVLADPVHTGTVFAGTDKRGLYKSTDCGSTWAKVNTGRNADLLDSGILWSIALDKTNPNTLYAGALYGKDPSLLRSLNGGVDWDTTFPEGSEIANAAEYRFFQDLALDPTDQKHILITFHSNCKGQFGPGCLGETKDGGTTWRILKSPYAGWSEGAGPFILTPTTWLLGTTQMGLYYTADSGANWEKVGNGSDRMIYKTTDGTYYVGSDYGMRRTKDGGHVWEEIANSPKSFAIIGDGKRLFASLRQDSDKQQPFFTSDETDGTTWTTFPTPKMANGGVYFAYDTDHHVLYSANPQTGLFRMVTQ